MSLVPPSHTPLTTPRGERALWPTIMLGAGGGALAATLAALVSPVLGIALGVILPALAPWLARRLDRASPPTPTEVTLLPSPEPNPPTPRPERLTDRPEPGIRVSGTWRTGPESDPRLPDPTPLVLMLTQASLRQIGLVLERLSQASAPPPFIALARGSLQRAREALALLDRPQSDTKADSRTLAQREPFAMREDLVAVARAVGFELGREVAVRFSSGFPAQTLGDRSTARIALTALMLEAARYLERTRPDPLTQPNPERIELLVEASHEDIVSQRAVIRIVVDAHPDVPALPPPPPLGTIPVHLAALDALLRKSAVKGGGAEPKTSLLLGTPDGRRIGFELPVVRYKRLTGTTLFGVGALADRAVLVIEPRTLSRISICEALASWRLRPTAVSTVDDAVSLLAERSDSRPLGRFDMVILGIGDGEEACALQALAEHRDIFERLPIVTLESLECLARPLPPDTTGLGITRLPRPLGPTDLLEVATGALAPAPRATPKPKPQHGGLTVLIAEDNPVNQAFIVKLLERRGVSIILANNGADALDRVQETPDAFDAIFMDLQMPVMDGYEATAVLRLRENQAGRARTPIIAITAHALDGERERCLEADMDDYLSKPVDEASLFAALSRVAKQKRATEHKPPGAAFDRVRVLDFAAGDKSFLSNLVTLFADTSPRQLDAIRDALAQGDGAALHRAAHQLKGSVSNFGAHAAYDLAAQLEALGKAGNLTDAPTIAEALEAEVAAVRAGLAQLLTELR